MSITGLVFSIGTFYVWTLTGANVLKSLEFVLYSLANTSIRITCAMDTEQQITRCAAPRGGTGRRRRGGQGLVGGTLRQQRLRIYRNE